MTSPTDTHVMTARSPEDVLAVVPVVLGFMPEESVVMLTFGAEHPFHARVDIPIDDEERRDCAEALLEPVLRHGVSAVLFVVYIDDPAAAAACAGVLAATFESAGVDVLTTLRSDGACWFVVPRDPLAVEGPGTPYDVSGHVFTAWAVASGRVTRSSRDELVASVAADERSIRAVEKARAVAAVDPADPTEQSAWLLATVEGLRAGQARADPQTAARLLLALRGAAVRDALLRSVDPTRADGLVPVLSALVRASPADLLAPVASVLAFVAWLAGDGALAWCALDRAAEGNPGCALAEPVAEALARAVPPTVWERW